MLLNMWRLNASESGSMRFPSHLIPVSALIPYMPALMGGTVSGEEYRYAVSNSCVIFFLVELALSIIVMLDAYRRGLPGLMWGFISFGLPYIGVPIYLIYIVLAGHTRFHLRKEPAAEEIKKKWEDTESSLDRQREKEGVKVKKGPKDDGLSPYRKV